MRRKISDRLLQWKDNKGRKTLLVKGGRQIGKTYSIEEFGKKYYNQYIYINFEKEPDLKLIFEGNIDENTIIDRIQLRYRIKIEPENCLIFFDEIGYCEKAYSSLKWFTESGKYNVVASGSLLGILLNKADDSNSPMGYVDILEMHPMDFEEFLWAMKVSEQYINQARTCINSKIPMDEFLLKTFSDLYRRYMIVGGMPEAVKCYSESNDYTQTRKILEDVMSMLRDDVSKYSTKPDKLKIIRCLDSIPAQLSKENNIFLYTDVSKENASSRKYESSLTWLEYAGIIKRSFNMKEPVPPLSVQERRDSFKVFIMDSGLLMSMLDYSDAYTVITKDPGVNNGSIMENITACALNTCGVPLRFFRNKDSTMELDFFINLSGTPTGIEVKSGKKTRAKSIMKMCQTYKNTKAIKLMEGNIMIDEKGILHLPLFAPWLTDYNPDEIPKPDYLERLAD